MAAGGRPAHAAPLPGRAGRDLPRERGTGDEVICLGDASIAYEGIKLATTAVFRGERANGTVNIKIDLEERYWDRRAAA
jgi:hypothetical protein